MTQMEQLQERYPDLESLTASMDGKTKRQWEEENGFSNKLFYNLKKKYENLPTPESTGTEQEPEGEKQPEPERDSKPANQEGMSVAEAVALVHELTEDIKSIDTIIRSSNPPRSGVEKILKQYRQEAVERGSRIKAELDSMTIRRI